MNDNLNPSKKRLSAAEKEFERAIRPADFHNFYGQEKVIENIMVFVQAAKARKEALDATWSMYLPAQYELVQKSETLEKDGFILFAVTEQMDSIKAIFEKATK